MTAVRDSKTEAQLQAESARATASNVEQGKLAAKLPPLPKAKLFRCNISSMQMIMEHGKLIVFHDNQFITNRPDEVEYLLNEIESGNSMISPQVEDVEPVKTLAEMRAEIEAAAIARYIAETAGGKGNAGTSSQEGAGQAATTSTLVETPEQAMLRQKGLLVPETAAEIKQEVTAPAPAVKVNLKQ